MEPSTTVAVDVYAVFHEPGVYCGSSAKLNWSTVRANDTRTRTVELYIAGMDV